MKSIISIIFILILVGYSHESGCNKNGTTLTCSDLNLTNKKDIPANNVENIEEIIFENCIIPLIPSGMFTHFGKAKKLTMYKNQIQTIQPGAFNGMTHLNYLYLRENRISNLQSGTINSLRKLQTLRLWNNQLTKIDKNYFANLSDLNYLDLDGNLIEVITDDAFEGLFRLKDLDLRRNRFKSLPAGCFKDLNILQHLYLHSNLFTKFEYGVFAGLNSLTTLYISDNHLSTLNECSFLPLYRLTSLHIYNNKLTYINTKKLITALPKLQKIYLNGNQWYCNILSDMVPTFLKRGIDLGSNTTTTTNFFGFSCVNETVPDSIRKELVIEDCVSINSTITKNNSFAISNSTEFVPRSTVNESAPENGDVILNNKIDNNVDGDFIEIIYNTMLKIRTNKGIKSFQRVV